MAKNVVYNHRPMVVCDAALDPSLMARILSPEEEGQFLKWAQSQPAGVEVNPLWHPVVQDWLLTTGHGVEVKDGSAASS